MSKQHASIRSKKRNTKGQRTCIACRILDERANMLRFVTDSQDQVWLDPYLKAPGRGAHLCYRLECLERVYQKHSFKRAFKKNVQALPQDEMRQSIVQAQESKIQSLLSLGRKQRKTKSGLNLLQNGAQTLYLVIASRDVSSKSLMKIRSAHSCPVLIHQDRFLLGTSQGKSERVAIGINDALLADTLTKEIHRYNQFLIASENHLKINTSYDPILDI
jgi:predicted RNA-binding protein YlxR (DUF448 family)